VGNIALLELRNGVPTGLVPGSAVTAAGSPRNARTFVPVAWRLQPGREYAAIARVVRQRASPAPADARDVQVHGALSFQAADPCTVPVLTADPTAARMWLRWSRELPGGFVEFGAGVVGSAGVPVLQGIGVPARGQTCALHADRVAPSALAFLVAGQAVLGLHVLGGVLLPSPEVVSGYLVSGAGTLDVPVAWPITVSAAYFQLVVLDAAAPFGVAASNAVLGQVQ
jgi:hypothetical protein